MTVRLTPTESGNPQPPPRPAPPHTSGVLPPGDGPDAPSAPDGTGAETRRALREARRARRRTAWLCAAFVALCLGLTIVVVSLARYRPAGPPASLAAAEVVVPSDPVPSAAAAVDRVVSSDPYRGAAAPEGGNP
jgi:hypothetical protein